MHKREKERKKMKERKRDREKETNKPETFWIQIFYASFDLSKQPVCVSWYTVNTRLNLDPPKNFNHALLVLHSVSIFSPPALALQTVSVSRGDPFKLTINFDVTNTVINCVVIPDIQYRTCTVQTQGP